MSRIVGTFEGKAKLWPGEIPGSFEPGFVEQPIIEDLRGSAFMQNFGAGFEDCHAFRMGECRILLNREPAGIHFEQRWHLTISCPDRHPSWDEIKTARYRLLGPDLAVAMILPQPRFYVNVPEQDHVFQLWEIDDPARVWETG